MTHIDIAEMICDWMAISQERNTDIFKWAKDNINIRWKFTNKQEKLIHELIGVLCKV